VKYGSPFAFALRGESTIAVIDSTEGSTVIERINGKNEYFSIQGVYGKQIASEPGSLFLEVNYASAPCTIVEIRCTE
jgi:hypothetical protein